MSKTKFKTVLGRGIALAIPVAIVLYVFLRIIGMLKKALAPVAADIGIQHIWGELTLTIFAIILIVGKEIIFFLQNFFIYKNNVYNCAMKRTTIQCFIPQLIYQRG